MLIYKLQAILEDKLIDFNWTEFQEFDWDSQQKFIFVFPCDSLRILTYSQFMKSNHVARVGVKRYLPIED